MCTYVVWKTHRPRWTKSSCALALKCATLWTKYRFLLLLFLNFRHVATTLSVFRFKNDRNVLQVSDDKNLEKLKRKELQVLKASSKSNAAKLVALADKINNIQSFLTDGAPQGWSSDRVQNYVAWSFRVVQGRFPFFLCFLVDSPSTSPAAPSASSPSSS